MHAVQLAESGIGAWQWLQCRWQLAVVSASIEPGIRAPCDVGWQPLLFLESFAYYLSMRCQYLLVAVLAGLLTARRASCTIEL